MSSCSLFQLGRPSGDAKPSTNHQDSLRGCGCLSFQLARSIALLCCSSNVRKEHCGRPCCVATTRACDLDGQKTVDVTRSSTLRSSISTTFTIAENTQISFPLRANPNDRVPVQQIDGIINVPVSQIPGPIVEAVKHIPQEWVQQCVVLQIATACGRYWTGAPRARLGVCPS